MARPLRITYPGAFYHVTSRGNEGKVVFRSRADRLQFLSYLASATERYNAAVHCYGLMGNHYHLLVETPSGNLPQIMRHINGAYTAYFNRKRNRAGHLFQGRYKAILVEKDAYAKELSRYIHLNPVKAKLTEKAADYEWTSYRAYIGAVPAPEWLRPEFILGAFSPRKAVARRRYEAFVNAIPGADGDSPLQEAAGGILLGSLSFVETIKAAHLANRTAGRDLPEIKRLQEQPSAAAIDSTVERIAPEAPKLVRSLKIYFNQRYSGNTLKQIGQRFAIGESAVSQVCRRLEKRKAGDAVLSRLVKKIEKDLKSSKG